jgi:UDP-glucuronate decarboxylase
MIDLGADKKIVITGAGGWLGTELLELLLEEHGSASVAENVICLGSYARSKTLSDGTKVEIRPLDSELAESCIQGFVHLAFQTRDKVEVLGLEKYTFTNIRHIEQLNPQWICTVSSGAVFSGRSPVLENNLAENPYGFTKRIEESILADVAHRLGANFAIGRLWGAMGRHMPINRAYAISDFIMQGLETGRISINSGHKVWRKYCDAQDFMNILICSAQSEPGSLFDSGGTLIEIGALAQMVSSELGLEGVVSRPTLMGADDRYFPDSSEYEQLSHKFAIQSAPIESLVKQTLESHQRLLYFQNPSAGS